MSRFVPIVSGKETTFVAIGQRLGINPTTAADRYYAASDPVTWHKLSAPERAAQRRRERDEAITNDRRRHGALLRELANIHGVTPQRIQQIAGPIS